MYAPHATVAIVDDDPSVRRALSRLMRSCGLMVVTYASAEEFLASARPLADACLLLDLHMPGMSGIELLEELDAEGRSLPTIVVTSHASDAVCIPPRIRVAAILRKPVESATLVAAVGHAIGRDLAWD